MRNLAYILLLLFAAPTLAEAPPLAPVPEASVPAAPTTNEEELEPEVRIIQRKEGVIHEYRINGQLYMVKVVPTRGYPYYLVDSNGDGTLDARNNDLDPGLVVPRWMIYRW